MIKWFDNHNNSSVAVQCLHTSLYFCSVLASLASQASTVALLVCRVVSRWVRSAGGNEERLLSWANKIENKLIYLT